MDSARRADGIDTLSPESVRAGIEQMASAAEPAIDEIANLAQRAAQTLDREQLQKLLEGFRSYIREYPLAAIAIGVAAGYLISRLASSR